MKEETRIFTGGMNKDDDPRFIENGDWIDALNKSVSNEQGTNGNIVEEIGNEEIALYVSTGNGTYSLPSGTNTAIGSVDDPVRGHTYWFVHNSNGNHTILRYEYTTNIARLVLEDANPSSSSAYSQTTDYARGDVVSSGGNFYTLGRIEYRDRVNFDSRVGNIITVDADHFCKTGDRRTFRANGGSIGGLSDGTTYYVISDSTDGGLSTDQIKLADSFANALAGNEITLSGATFTTPPYFEDPLGAENTDAWYQSHNVLNFDLSYPIYKAVVVDQSSRVYLIWTDNNEQPSFLEVTSLGSAPTYRGGLDLYVPQPHHPPTAEYGSDSAGSDQNNVAKKALQFRYAWKYSDGRTSVMSPISRIPMPTVASYNNIQDDNKVQLQIPLPFQENPDEVYLYVKTNGDNNTGDWYLADTYDVSEETIKENPAPYGDRYLRYIADDFFNTSTLAAVPTTLQDQIQDFIPLKSKALAVSGNGRLLLGNNLDGFDFDVSTLDVQIEATNTPDAPIQGDAPLTSAKKGCRYPIGIVYGDRSGRLSNVYRNEDMVLEAPFWNYSNRGQVKCKMSIGHAPPSWAEFWIPVYAGNQTMEGWRQSALSGVSLPSLTLYDISDYNNNRSDSTGYNYSFSNGQKIRGIWDETAKNFFDVTNGDGEVLSASTYTLKSPAPSFTTNLADDDLAEVYTAKKTTDPEQQLWYEMGWAFKIGTDLNGNKVHTATNSSYSTVDNYDNTTYTVTNVAVGVVTIGAGHSYQTGDPFLFVPNGGTVTGGGGLTDYTVYYAINPSGSSTQLQVATTRANAELGTPIALTGFTGSPTFVGNNTTFEVQDQIIGAASQDCVAVLDQFDCYIRNFSDLESTTSTYKAFEFENLFPDYESEIKAIGRPNTFNPDYKQTRREQEIVFSEPIVDNTDFFGINRFFDVSFNDSLSNDYGELNILHSDGDEVLCVQETKTARMLANKNFIFTGDLQSLDIQSNTFLSEPRYFPQEFGTQNPESFVEHGGFKFWVDKLRGAVIRCAGSQMENIGQAKMSTYFEQNLPYPYPYNANADGNNNKIYGGYCIKDNSYYITMDAHKIIKRSISSTSGTEYEITFTDIDMEDGTFDRLDDLGVVPVKSTVGSYDEPWTGLTKVSSDSSAQTITVDGGVSISVFSVAIYVPYVDTLSFSNDRGRWISKHDFKPEWIGSSANSLCTFKDGKLYVHQLEIYDTAFFTQAFNYCRFYGTTYNSFLEFPFNREPNINKEPITVAVDGNVVHNIDYAFNEGGQITETDLGDYEEYEDLYWSPIFRDKTTPVVTYPLLEGDLIKGKYLRCRYKSVARGGYISSTKLKYNNSNLT